ncbi:hypothetical protein PMIN03_001445 [Paraphaeosphaeria minitans]
MPPRTLHDEREELRGTLLSMAHLGGVGHVGDDIADQVIRTLGGDREDLRGPIHVTILRPPHAAAAAPYAADPNRGEASVGESFYILRGELQALGDGFDDHGRRFMELPSRTTVRDGRRGRSNNRTINTPTGMSQDDNSYDLMVQGSAARSVHYGRGFRNRWPAARVRYRSDRDIPLSRDDTCRCILFRTEFARHIAPSLEWYDFMQTRIRDERRRTRRQALGETGLFSTIPDRILVELRQARALAGIDVSVFDVEITRRILADPSGWGAVGSALRNRGWVDEVLDDGDNYVFH